ncbi:MAG: GIY-YIG nuclease family protein [Candidatus Nanoarchaeia archaeon]|nr:GIY-YIG nuclease family protein [Candidatus Nanoarchaeia archaeon]
MKGAYVLIFEVLKDCEIIVGKLGLTFFKKGIYYYCGSAQNNLEKRIERHERKEKKIHWHIDYLTTNKNIKMISSEKYENCQKSKECELAQELFKKKYNQIKNFGCTDCKCNSHLFYKNE